VHNGAVTLDPGAVRHGRVRGRYFRENFAQGGIDLVQIVPELVTNADAAIAASGRQRGRIELAFAPPDRDWLAHWRAELRRLPVPAMLSWRHEIVCTDDGEGMNAELVALRLGALGERPIDDRQRGLFGRGLRDVWLAQGGGRIEGARAGRLVESWFFPAAGDEPYAYVHVRDEPASGPARAALGLDGSGTRVTVPLAARRLPPSGRLRTLVAQLVQLRPVLEDPERELWLTLPGEPVGLVTYPRPEPDPERPVLFEGEVEVAPDVTARIVVRRAAEPFTLGPSRATRRGGLVVRSGRAAHEATLAGHESRPGARHLYGELRCDAIERLQRRALDSPRPQVVVRVDRSGLNEHHPVVQRLYAAIDRVLRPIVADEERRAGARLVAPGKEIRARDQQGLRALNDALRSAFESPGTAPVAPGGAPTEQPPLESPERRFNGAGTAEHEPSLPPEPPSLAMRFKQSPCGCIPASVAAPRCCSTRVGSRRERRSAWTPTPACGSASAAKRCPTPARGPGRASPWTCGRGLRSSRGRASACWRRPVTRRRSSRSWSCATPAAAGCGRSPGRTRTRLSRHSSIPRAVWSPSTRADASSAPWNARPAEEGSGHAARASTSLTACSRWRWPRTPSTSGRPSGSSNAARRSSAERPARPTTLGPSTLRRRRYGTAPTSG
jgi:hypothetical protein